jgi:hypothetical protein
MCDENTVYFVLTFVYKREMHLFMLVMPPSCTSESTSANFCAGGRFVKKILISGTETGKNKLMRLTYCLADEQINATRTTILYLDEVYHS